MASYMMGDYDGIIYNDSDIPQFYRAAVDGDRELLLSCIPSDINEAYRSKTALHLAVYKENTEIVQTLLRRGAKVNVTDEAGWTPLHLASESSNTAAVQLLLNFGADPSARDENQSTPLHVVCASITSEIAVVKLLLAFGADISVRERTGQTPMQAAVVMSRFESASLMLTMTASPQQTWVNKLVTTAEDTEDYLVKRDILTLCEDILTNPDLNFKDDTVLYWSDLGLANSSFKDKLQQLPENVRYQALFLHNNQISILPNLVSCKQLQSLSYLILSDNPIHTIEGLPPQLKALYCDRTEVKVLGKACFHNSSIDVLKHALKDAGRYSSLKQPPRSVFEHGLEDILRYFTKELMTNSQYRIVAIGDTGAGKSSCLESVILGQPYLTREADRTHVLDLKHWRVNDKDFFTFFDQGGHEVYDITNPYFIAIKSMVLIFQDLSKTENIPRTLDILRRSLHQHPQNIIHFVLTHIDQVDQVKQSVQLFKEEIHELLQGEISTFKRLLASPKNKGYIQEKDIQSLLENCQEKQSNIQLFPISSKTYEGIEKLITFLKSTIEKERVNIPILWIDCLQKMEESKVSFWTKSKLLEVMNVSLSSSQDNQSDSQVSLSGSDHVIGEVPSASDHNSEVVDCLRYLNDTGMVIWMEDHDTLKNYIFHDIEFLIEILKSLFHHDLKSTIQYETDLHLQSAFTETQFEDTLKKYQEEGILKFTFLQYLWRKYELHENDELALITLIRQFHLFSEIPSGQDKVFFVPWFVKKNKVPPNFNVSDPLVINSKEVSLNMECLFHNRLPLNVTEHFLVEVQGYVYEQGVKGSRYAWADGLQVQIDETTITAFRNVDQATLSLVITAECDYLAKMWDSLQQLNGSLKAILKSYHGSLRSHHSKCLHCKKVGICPVHRWLLEDVLPEPPYKDLYMRCDKDKPTKIPAALVTRMPNDDKLEQRLHIVRTYLQTAQLQVHPVEGDPSTPLQVCSKEHKSSSPRQDHPNEHQSSTQVPQSIEVLHHDEEYLTRRLGQGLNLHKIAINPHMMSTSVQNLDKFDRDSGMRGLFSHKADYKLTKKDFENVLQLMGYVCAVYYHLPAGTYNGTGLFLGFVEPQVPGNTVSIHPSSVLPGASNIPQVVAQSQPGTSTNLFPQTFTQFTGPPLITGSVAVILISGHNLEKWNPNVQPGELIFDYYERFGNVMKSSSSGLIAADFTLDYALLFTSDSNVISRFQNVPQPRHMVTTSIPPNIPPPETTMTLLGHPNDSHMQGDHAEVIDKQTVLKDNAFKRAISASKFGAKKGANLHIVEEDYTIIYNCSSFHGASGAPCFQLSDGNVQLVCIHGGGIFFNKTNPTLQDRSDYEFGILMPSVLSDINGKLPTLGLKWN